MKRILRCLLAAVLLISCISFAAFAAKAGDTVTVSFTTSGNPGFASYGATVNYDSTALELVKIEAGALSQGSFAANKNIASYFGTSDVTGDGVLFTATFKIKDNAAIGEYPVTATLDALSTSNAADDYVTFTIKGETVSVVCDHKWSAWTVETPADCKTVGKEVRTCSVCNAPESREIPKTTNHVWGAWTVETPADCKTVGKEVRTCSVCATPESRDIPKTEHTLSKAHDDKYHWDECSKCDYTGPKEEHAFGTGDTCVCGQAKPAQTPETGDVTPVIVITTVVFLSLMAMALVLLLKRKTAN